MTSIGRNGRCKGRSDFRSRFCVGDETWVHKVFRQLSSADSFAVNPRRRENGAAVNLTDGAHMTPTGLPSETP